MSDLCENKRKMCVNCLIAFRKENATFFEGFGTTVFIPCKIIHKLSLDLHRILLPPPGDFSIGFHIFAYLVFTAVVAVVNLLDICSLPNLTFRTSSCIFFDSRTFVKIFTLSDTHFSIVGHDGVLEPNGSVTSSVELVGLPDKSSPPMTTIK